MGHFFGPCQQFIARQADGNAGTLCAASIAKRRHEAPNVNQRALFVLHVSAQVPVSLYMHVRYLTMQTYVRGP